MPQLNPGPWFTILLIGWAIFGLIVPQKVIDYMFPKDPSGDVSGMPKSMPWHWRWH